MLISPYRCDDGVKFEPGYILDSFKEEQDRGMTIDQTSAEIVYKNSGLPAYHFIFFDSLITFSMLYADIGTNTSLGFMLVALQ